MSRNDERRVLLQWFVKDDAELYRVAKELDLQIVNTYDKDYEQHQRRGTYFHIRYDEKDKIVEKIASSISDEKLVETFARIKPKSWYDLGFRGKFYQYQDGSADLVLCNAWKDVKRDVLEALSQTGERGYAFLKAIVELHEEGK